MKDEQLVNPADTLVAFDPDPTSAQTLETSWNDYATTQYTYDGNNVVTGITYANGQSLSFSYSTNPASFPQIPSDIVSQIVMVTTVCYSGQRYVSQAVDSLGRLRFEWVSTGGSYFESRRMDVDSQGRLTAVSHCSDSGRANYLSIYQTGYDPNSNSPSGGATTYPAYHVVEYQDGGNTVYRVLAHYTYGVPGFPGLPLTKTTYTVGDSNNVNSGVEGVNMSTTNYGYNADGTLQYVIPPLVKGGLLPGQQAPRTIGWGSSIPIRRPSPARWSTRRSSSATRTPSAKGASRSF